MMPAADPAGGLDRRAPPGDRNRDGFNQGKRSAPTALISVVGSYRVDGVESLDHDAGAQIAAAWSNEGFELVSMRPATVDDVRGTRSSWARRLRDRPVWQVELRQCGPSDGT